MPQTPANPSTIRLYVGNLVYSVDDVALRTAFSIYGRVLSAKVLRDDETGRSQGFAFVEMNERSAAMAAISGLNGAPIGGRTVVVNEARPRDDSQRLFGAPSASSSSKDNQSTNHFLRDLGIGAAGAATALALNKLRRALDQPQPSHQARRQRGFVFICHASEDKEVSMALFRVLAAKGLNPWLDVEMLLPGQDWELEIRRAIRLSEVVIVLLSNTTASKSGFVQKEIRFALDVADEQPEGRVFIIPALIGQCTVPDRLKKWQWVDLTSDDGQAKLLGSILSRQDA